MVFLDSSVIVDYLDDVESVVDYVDDQSHLLTSSICVFEVLQGEVLGSGPTDVLGAREKFGSVKAIDFNETIAIETAHIQDKLGESGETVSARDLMIAATARSTGDELVVTDADFQTTVLEELITITNLRE